MGRLAYMPGSEAHGVDPNAVGKPGVVHELMHDSLGHGRAADISQADEEDLNHRLLVSI